MNSVDFLQGVGDWEDISVERAIAEFRAGRLVIIENTKSACLVAAVETLGAAQALGMEALGSAQLILSGPRLHRLGAPRREPGVLALPTVDKAKIDTLVFARDAVLTDTVAPLSEIKAAAALTLTHLAALLPAAIVLPLKEGMAGHYPLQRVEARAIEAYRNKRVQALHIVSRAPVPLEGALQSELVIFRGGEGMRDHAAVIVGTPDLSKAVAVRLHSACLTGDLFGSLKCDCGDQLRMTVQHMAQQEGGIILYLDQEGRGNGIANKIKAYALQDQGLDTYDADELLGFDHDQRGFDFAADMLKQLGVQRVCVLTNNPVKVEALTKAGLDVVAQQRVFGRPTEQNIGYLQAKRDRAGHKLAADLSVADHALKK